MCSVLVKVYNRCMKFIDILGLLAGILTSIRFIPQVHKTYKMRETMDISLWFLIIVTLQAIFLMLYGFLKPDNWILFMNILPLACSLMLLYYKWRYKWKNILINPQPLSRGQPVPWQWKGCRSFFFSWNRRPSKVETSVFYLRKKLTQVEWAQKTFP